jgi:hypothetical protein
MPDDLSQQKGHPFIEIADLPSIPHKFVEALCKRIHQKFSHLPYGDQPNYGRSLLNEQLENIEDISIRDCKLPTYLLVETLKSQGYEVLLLTKEEFGTHPYICVRMPNYQDLILFASFHPENFVCYWLTWSNGYIVKWGKGLESWAENNGYNIVETTDAGWKLLDRNFLKAKENEF